MSCIQLQGGDFVNREHNLKTSFHWQMAERRIKTNGKNKRLDG